MKRSISLEASEAAARLRQTDFATQAACAGFFGNAASSLALFGLGFDSSWPQVRQAYLIRLRQFPPDRNPAEFIQTVDAYETLKRLARSAADAEAAAAASDAFGSSGGKRRRVGDVTLAASTASAASAGGCLGLATGTAPVLALDMAGVCHMGACQVPPAAMQATGGILPPAAAQSSVDVAVHASGCGSAASSGSSGAPGAGGFAGRHPSHAGVLDGRSSPSGGGSHATADAFGSRSLGGGCALAGVIGGAGLPGGSAMCIG